MLLHARMHAEAESDIDRPAVHRLNRPRKAVNEMLCSTRSEYIRHMWQNRPVKAHDSSPAFHLGSVPLLFANYFSRRIDLMPLPISQAARSE